MKILFLSHKFYPDIGGIEVNSEILAHAFHKTGHDIRLITWTDTTGDKSFPFPVIRKPSLSTLLKLHGWADVVFENNPCLRLAWPGIFWGKPSVVALRTWVRRAEGKKGWQDWLKQIWLQRASAVIAVSDAVRQKDWPAATVIGNPYRFDLFRVLPAVSKSADFIFFGRLVSDKGVAIALRAFERLLATPANRNLRMTIVGDGPERQRLEALVEELKLGQNVTFTGALRGEALVNCLNQHRFLLVPSLWEEPFGNVALEGMACGCLPIVSEGGGLPDAVGKAGLTFSRGSVESLVESLQQLLADRDLEAKLRHAAPQHLAEHHPEVVSRRYLEVVEKAFHKAHSV